MPLNDSLKTPPIALTIAGSEATGGAGAQADLKTFAELEVFGIAALTCIVSFNPQDNWNHRFMPVPPEVISEQLEAILATYAITTTKIGMLGSPATIDTVEAALGTQEWRNVVLDPVLICKGQEPGHALDTDNALKSQILPTATFVTPNHFESLSLSGMSAIESPEDLMEAARRIHEASGAAVLAKGGVRLAGPDAVDAFVDDAIEEFLVAPKVGEVAVSGAGCTLAAAVTAELAKGNTAYDAARLAKAFVTEAIQARVPSNAPFDAVFQAGLRSTS